MPNSLEQVDEHHGAAPVVVPPESFPVVAPPNLLVTFDTERTEHIISDEQLTQLSQGGGDISLELCLAAIGVGAGFAQNLYAMAVDVTTAKVIGQWDALGALICVAAVTAALFNGMRYLSVRRDMKALVLKIKSRKLGRMPGEGGVQSRGA